MATIIFAPVTFNLAETTRMIQVARALDPAHTPLFMGYEDDFVSLITDAGFDYVPGAPSWGAAERKQAIDFDQGRAIRSPFTASLVAARVAVERDLIRRHSAAALVTGSNLTSFLSARAERIPLVYPVPFGLTEPQVAQVRRLGLVPGHGRVARTADRVATAGFRVIYNRLPLAPRSFSSVARTVGVAPLRTVASLLRADVNLLTEMPWALDGFTLPADFRRVGPIFAHLDTPLPPLVTELAAADRPLVYLGLGSSADRTLALAAARALGELDVNVVAPLRHYLAAADVVPPTVHVTDLLPAHRLGGLVDAAVLHGGQGTVQTACAAGVPFVGMGLQPEQRWNVQMCERRGNAVAVAPKRVGSPEFVSAVRRVLHDPAIRRAADEVALAYAGEDGAAASARVIEGLIEDGSGPVR